MSDGFNDAPGGGFSSAGEMRVDGASRGKVDYSEII
jgi:hypothetical protein